MKRFMVLVIGLVFLFCTSAIAAETKKVDVTTPAATATTEPAKAEKKEVKKDVKKKAEKKKAEKKKAEKKAEKKADKKADVAAPVTK